MNTTMDGKPAYLVTAMAVAIIAVAVAFTPLWYLWPPLFLVAGAIGLAGPPT